MSIEGGRLLTFVLSSIEKKERKGMEISARAPKSGTRGAGAPRIAEEERKGEGRPIGND
jgi:hypothetical protein